MSDDTTYTFPESEGEEFDSQDFDKPPFLSKSDEVQWFKEMDASNDVVKKLQSSRGDHDALEAELGHTEARVR